jgi:outer membrane protein, heavy metal efflux system
MLDAGKFLLVIRHIMSKLVLMRCSLRFVRYAAFGLCLLATDCVYAAKKLSLDQVLDLFYQQNLDLIAAQYNIDSAKADELAAGAIPNPQISVQFLELSHNPNMGSQAQGCNSNPHVSCGVAEYYSFSQLIEMAGRRGLRMESSGFATRAAEADFRDALRIFSSMVRGAYYDLLLAQKNVWLAQEVAAHYQEILRANALRLKSGDLAEADYLRVKTEATRAQTDLDAAQAALMTARAALAVILRWPEQSVDFEVGEEWPDGKPFNQYASSEQLIDLALNQRPDLVGDQQRAEQAKKELELARRLKYPDLTVNAGYARDPSNNTLNSFFVGVSVPVPLFYQYQGESDKAVAGLNQAQLAVEQTGLSIRKDIVGAWATWTSTDQIIKRYQGGLLEDAKTIRDSSELAFTKGASGVLEFIDAQRSYKSVMRDYYAALVNRAQAYYDLQKATANELTQASTMKSKSDAITQP